MRTLATPESRFSSSSDVHAIALAADTREMADKARMRELGNRMNPLIAMIGKD